MKKLIIMIIATTVVTVGFAGDSAPFLLDTRDDNLANLTPITLTWDASWIGGQSDATIVISDNGTEIKRTTGTGTFSYAPQGEGLHTLTYTTYISGVAQDEIYAAQWKINTYTVTYKPGANGSGSQQTATKTHGVALTLKGATFTRSGYTQTGWATSDGGSKAYDLGASYTANAAITLYPFWMADSGDDIHDGVQLWEGGPYWAECNVGASRPEEYGYYFWWGDTVGYKREGNAWKASDGSSSNFYFDSSNTPTYGKTPTTLQSEGWITADGVLAPEHDAAQVQWGGSWRMPTATELYGLCENCSWTWTTKNGVTGCEVRGRGAYDSNSIFLPCAGYGHSTSLYDAGPFAVDLDDALGFCWSSVPGSYDNSTRYLRFDSYGYICDDYFRYFGRSVRPVQGFTDVEIYAVTLDRQGGSGGTPRVMATYGSEMPSITPPTRSGYTFEGYYTGTHGSGTQYYTASGASARTWTWNLTSATTLYAKWAANASDGHEKVQLWEGGPYWATTNIGAEKPEDYGYYFWWGDTVGHKRENDAWVATDGSSSNFSFIEANTPTYNKSIETLQSEGWITADEVLAPAHDAAHVKWGGD